MFVSVNHCINRLKTCLKVFCSQNFVLHELRTVTFIVICATEFMVSLAEVQEVKHQKQTCKFITTKSYEAVRSATVPGLRQCKIIWGTARIYLLDQPDAEHS